MDFICAVTGSLPDDDAPTTDTGPLGWVKVTLERQVPNPEFQQLQQLKESMVEQQFAAVQDQIPEGDEEAAAMVRLNIAYQIRAMFASLEAEMDEYVSQYEEAFLSTPELDEDVASVLQEFREAVGLADGDDMDEDEEDDEDAAEEPEGEEG